MKIYRKAASALTALALAAAACSVDDGGEVRVVDDGGSVSASASASASGSASGAADPAAAPSDNSPPPETPEESGAADPAAAPSDNGPPPETPEDPGAGASDADREAVLQTYRIVFDSSIPFDEKLPYLEDAEQLRGVFEEYAETAEGFGGISLDPTAVEIEGDEAAVTYNVMFGGRAAYSDLTGDAVRVDGVWSVTRARFCAFMSSARVSCPSPSG